MRFYEVTYRDANRPAETVRAEAMQVNDGHLMFFGRDQVTGAITDVLSAYAPGIWITAFQVDDRGTRKETSPVDELIKPN